MTATETYAAIPYDNFPLPRTHPSRLHALGKMAGMSPAPVKTCRVLELGASEGANLLAMAARFPHAEFTGVDLAGDAVQRGTAVAHAFGLRNLHLVALDLLDFDASFGSFDYVIAHGVYAWTPPNVRDKVLAIMSEALSPHGIGFVSYNTQPVGHIRRMVREMLLFHGRDAATPEELASKAREMLSLLARPRSQKEVNQMDAYDAALAAHAAELYHQRSGNQMFHDDLALSFEPVALTDFVAHARRRGLQYVDDAGAPDPRGTAVPKGLDATTVARIRAMTGGDRVAELQYHDYLRMRRFRQSMICRADIKLSDDWESSSAVRLHASTRVTEVAEGTFVSANNFQLATTHPVAVAYLRRLIEAWPGSEPVDEQTADVATALFRAGAIELHGSPSKACKPTARPCADALIRFQAQRGDAAVTTLWHEPLLITDGQRRLLIALDGATDCVDVDQNELDDLASHGVLIESSRCESIQQP